MLNTCVCMGATWGAEERGAAQGRAIRERMAHACHGTRALEGAARVWMALGVGEGEVGACGGP